MEHEHRHAYCMPTNALPRRSTLHGMQALRRAPWNPVTGPSRPGRVATYSRKEK